MSAGQSLDSSTRHIEFSCEVSARMGFSNRGLSRTTELVRRGGLARVRIGITIDSFFRVVALSRFCFWRAVRIGSFCGSRSLNRNRSGYGQLFVRPLSTELVGLWCRFLAGAGAWVLVRRVGCRFVDQVIRSRLAFVVSPRVGLSIGGSGRASGEVVREPQPEHLIMADQCGRLKECK